MLLFLRRASRRNPLVLPRMGVVLTCWDTFPEQSKFERPVDAFHSLAPLMADFIESSWDDSSVFVIALSALGRSLDKVRQDEEFMDTGPTSHGWLIKPDGENTQDLTFPIVRNHRIEKMRTISASRAVIGERKGAHELLAWSSEHDLFASLVLETDLPDKAPGSNGIPFIEVGHRPDAIC